MREETVRAILTAAEEVFAERGIRTARMEEIAHRAGVSVGTLYNHFEDREGLVSALVERGRAELAHSLESATDDGAPFKEQLRRFVRTVFEHFESKRQFLAIILEGDAANTARPSEAILVLRKRGEELVKRGLAQKALKSERSELFSAMLFGAIRASLVHELHNPDAMNFAWRADAVVDFFLHGAGVSR
jgi:AcrR family transcriptional regulator